MSRIALSAAVLVAAVLAAHTAQAADPKSKVQSFEWKLGSYITITDTTTLEQGTLVMLVDPSQPSWSMQGGKLIVPDCNTTLSGSFTIDYTAYEGHNTSMLHWSIPGFGAAEWSIKASPSGCGSGAQVVGCGHDDFEKTFHSIGVQTKLGESLFNIQAWTSKKGQKSQVKSALLRVHCAVAPAPAAPLKLTTRPTLPPAKTKITTAPGSVMANVLPQLELRSVRLDFGFPDANAVEWYKGQAPQKEILFHEITGPGSEVGGNKWGAVAAVTVNGQTYQSRGIDSCSSALKLKKYHLRARNNGPGHYTGGTPKDIKASSNGPSGSFVSTGDIGAVAPNVEAAGVIDVASAGVVFFPSGAYSVSAELLAPAASSSPENNSAQLSLTFKCKAINATTWQ